VSSDSQIRRRVESACPETSPATTGGAERPDAWTKATAGPTKRARPATRKTEALVPSSTSPEELARFFPPGGVLGSKDVDSASFSIRCPWISSVFVGEGKQPEGVLALVDKPPTPARRRWTRLG